MIVSRDREKLIHAIVYFCRYTKHCHTLKLFKLLNLLDTEHFRQTGRTVTGLHYYAWPQGPVPAALWEEIDQGPKPDLQRAITITTRKDGDTGRVQRRDIKPKIEFNKKLFTPREFGILNRLNLLFDTARGEDMSELTHMKGLPWRKVWRGGAGDRKEIPAELSLGSEPLMDAPTIDPVELAYRKDLRQGIQ
jgi:uncharacterized phage-associated protein